MVPSRSPAGLFAVVGRFNKPRILNAEMKAKLNKMTGTALLCAALAALVYVPTSGGGPGGAIVAFCGFVAFAGGCALFGNGLKLDIVEQIRRDK